MQVTSPRQWHSMTASTRSKRRAARSIAGMTKYSAPPSPMARPMAGSSLTWASRVRPTPASSVSVNAGRSDGGSS